MSLLSDIVSYAKQKEYPQDSPFLSMFHKTGVLLSTSIYYVGYERSSYDESRVDRVIFPDYWRGCIATATDLITDESASALVLQETSRNKIGIIDLCDIEGACKALELYISDKTTASNNRIDFLAKSGLRICWEGNSPINLILPGAQSEDISYYKKTFFNIFSKAMLTMSDDFEQAELEEIYRSNNPTDSLVRRRD